MEIRQMATAFLTNQDDVLIMEKLEASCFNFDLPQAQTGPLNPLNKQ